MENRKEAIAFLLESSVLGVMHKCQFQMTDGAKEVLDDLLRAAHDAGLDIDEIILTLKGIEKRFQESGLNVVFEFQYEDSKMQ